MFSITEYGEFFTGLLEHFQESILKRNISLGSVVEETKELTDRMGRDFVKYVIENVDEAYRNTSIRKMNFSIQRRNMEKTIATMLGPIQYQRTQFKDKRDGSYIYLTDELLGIKPHQRLDENVVTGLAHSAAYQSYGRTTNQYEFTGVHSKTTVMNCVREVGCISHSEQPIPKEKKEVTTLYIEADEDHVSLQSGKNDQMRLVYCHEGTEKVCKGRNRLKNAHYFTGWYKGRNEELWYEVLDYLYGAYNLDKVSKIVLRGDGAPWIAQGAKIIPNCEMQLDRYHMHKYITKATSPVDALESSGKNYYWYLYDKVSQGDKNGVRAYFDSVGELALLNTQKEAIIDSRKYLLSNWKAIQNSFKEVNPGCSTEPHVSHVLSSRLSSRPMGWSEVGAESVASIRAFELNGGNLKEYYSTKNNVKHKDERLKKLEKRIAKKVQKAYLIKQGRILYPTRQFEGFRM